MMLSKVSFELILTVNVVESSNLYVWNTYLPPNLEMFIAARTKKYTNSVNKALVIS